MLEALFNADYLVKIVELVVIALIVFATFKYANARYFLLTILAIVLVGSAVFSYFELNYYYKASGGIYGEITGYFNRNEVVVKDLSFDASSIMMTEDGRLDDNGNSVGYSAKFVSENVVDLTGDTIYGIFVNDEPCQITNASTNYMIATYGYNFKDNQLNSILNDVLTIRFSFYKNYTQLEISTMGGSSAVKLWNKYFEKNNFIISIKPSSMSYYITLDNEEIAPNLKKCDFKLNNDIVKTIYVTTGSKINAPVTIDEIKYENFSGWSLDGENIIDETDVIVNTNLTFTATADEKEYEVKFYDGDNLFATNHYKAYEHLNVPASLRPEDVENKIFDCWVDENGNAIPDLEYHTILITGDLNYFAKYLILEYDTSYDLTMAVLDKISPTDKDLILEISDVDFEIETSNSGYYLYLKSYCRGYYSENDHEMYDKLVTVEFFANRTSDTVYTSFIQTRDAYNNKQSWDTVSQYLTQLLDCEIYESSVSNI